MNYKFVYIYNKKVQTVLANAKNIVKKKDENKLVKISNNFFVLLCTCLLHKGSWLVR